MSWPMAFAACWRMRISVGFPSSCDAVQLREAWRRPRCCWASAPLRWQKRSSSADQVESYLFALIPGDTQIAWPKLRSLLGVSKMKLPDAAEALAATGYERGTITPIGSEPSWPVISDQRLAGHRAALGAGGHGYSACVEIDDLARLYEATVAD